MNLKENIIRIWKAKGQILEGVTNSIFKREDVELIATERMQICRACNLYDTLGTGCVVKGTEPCCNQDLGGCGCSLGFKTRSLSSDCPKGYWKAEITQQEEDILNQKLGL
jgi:hypothetical protein